MFDELLKYQREPEDDNFTNRVMEQIYQPDRSRQWILWLSGVIGAGFGVAGVSMLHSTAAQITSSISGQASIWPLAASGAAILLLGTWLFSESID